MSYGSPLSRTTFRAATSICAVRVILCANHKRRAPSSELRRTQTSQHRKLEGGEFRGMLCHREHPFVIPLGTVDVHALHCLICTVTHRIPRDATPEGAPAP
jgi:hypothetical protein